MLKKTLLLTVAFMGTTATMEKWWQAQRKSVEESTEIYVTTGDVIRVFPITKQTTIKDVKDFFSPRLNISHEKIDIDVIRRRCPCFKEKIMTSDTSRVQALIYAYKTTYFELFSK